MGVAGSNPVAPTREIGDLALFDTGLLFRPANANGAGQLLCYSDHVTFTLGNGAQFNLTRATAADAEETLTAWMMVR